MSNNYININININNNNNNKAYTKEVLYRSHGPVHDKKERKYMNAYIEYLI